MKNFPAFSFATLLVLSPLFLFHACSSSDDDSITACSAGDLDCLLNSMQLTDPTLQEDEKDPEAPEDSNRIILVPIPRAQLPVGVVGGTAPQIPTNDPDHPLPDITFLDPDTEKTLDIPFTDPNPCRPIVCYSIC